MRFSIEFFPTDGSEGRGNHGFLEGVLLFMCSGQIG